jgi:hypothetical protein
MYEKYTDEFLNTVSNDSAYLTLFNKLEKFDKFILEWNETDLYEFVKSYKSVSDNSINKYFQIIRDFYNFICEKEDVEKNKLKLKDNLEKNTDFQRLTRKTITEKHYKTLRDHSLIDIDGHIYNYRDAAILVLAWEGLMKNSEIKNLMKKDIEFFSLYGKEKCRINLKNRSFIIEDKDSVKIIKKTIDEQQYWIVASGRKKDHPRSIKDSPAFLRPCITRSSNKDVVANSSEILRRILRKIEKIYPGEYIDLYDINLGDIVRSRRMQYLFDKNITPTMVKDFSGKKSSCDLYWQEEAIIKMYRQEKVKNQQKL